MIETSLLNFIENQLSVTSKRQEILSANIANADTPGYRSQDVAFEEQMRSLSLRGTNTRHFAFEEPTDAIRVVDAGMEAKPNGNSVNLDREMTAVTKNGLEFVTLMQYLQHKLRTVRSSLSEGGSR